MYVEFLQKDQSKTFKKFLRKNKAGNGKQIGLQVTENLIQKYIAENQQNDRVSFLLQDIENEKAYEFELPIRAGEQFSLITAISQDLEESTDFDQAMEIKQKVYVNYKAEEGQNQNSLEEEVEEPKKKKGGFLSKIFGKKDEKIKPDTTSTKKVYDADMQKEFASEEENLFEEMPMHE
ncbi:hypothetical protein P4J09_19295, partial [Bacillus cereus]|nr:hypothetical protein [Bacillus cereus]